MTAADSGLVLVCAAVNEAGAAVARSRLEVLAADQWPPPVILAGPVNQTLPAHVAVSLPCRASARPRPAITWYKDGAPLALGSRLHVTDNGALQIEGR